MNRVLLSDTIVPEPSVQAAPRVFARQSGRVGTVELRVTGKKGRNAFAAPHGPL